MIKGMEYKSIIYEKTDNNSYSKINKSNRIMIFEGEYLNGERKEGKEYNYEEKLIYEGGYLNGKKNGKGKIYDDNGYLKYEGELLDGKKKWKRNRISGISKY